MSGTRKCYGDDCTELANLVMYMGLPGYLCLECSTAGGGLSWLWPFLPFNGWFVVVRGGYWQSLGQWLRGAHVNDDPYDF